MNEQQEQLRELPAVGKLLHEPRVLGWLEGHPETVVTEALRLAVEEHRQRILAGPDQAAGQPEAVLDSAQVHLQVLGSASLKAVINATGIVLHTGLGRAPLSQAALEAIGAGGGGYCNLEFELDNGKRGKRSSHVADLLCRLSGAEAATVVNNNAAATFLILKTLSTHFGPGQTRYRKRNVIVSRGQLVEIGGSYRLPEIMKASGVELQEVGTTNRTHLRDYEQAINERSAALMRVHTSNYRITGFTEEVPIGALVELGRRHDLPVVDDLGSGAMVRIGDEPVVAASLTAGADLVCFSGDKLLGGPQAGIILGRSEFVRAIESSPLMRTYRVDKLILLALQATLRVYLDEDQARKDIPALSMIFATPEEVKARAGRLAEALTAASVGGQIEVVADVSYAGGGSMPAEEMPTHAVRWRVPGGSPEQAARSLRRGDPPVIVRVRQEAVLFDCRTVAEGEVAAIAAAVADVISK